MSAQHPESGIPVLTEILKTPAPVYGVDLPERRAVPPEASGMAPAVASVGLPMVPSADQRLQASLPAPGQTPPRESALIRSAEPFPDTAALQRLRDEVREGVLQQLLGDVDGILEQRIREGLTEVVNTAVDGLACQLRHALKMTLESVLTDALEQEVERRRISKN